MKKTKYYYDDEEVREHKKKNRRREREQIREMKHIAGFVESDVMEKPRWNSRTSSKN